MVNTKHGRFMSTFWRSLCVFLLSVPVGAQVPEVKINNGIPRETVGHYRSHRHDWRGRPGRQSSPPRASLPTTSSSVRMSCLIILAMSIPG